MGLGARHLVLLCVALLVGCSARHRSSSDGVVVFDGPVALLRGDALDRAPVEFAVDHAATFVARVEEDHAAVAG